MTSADPCGARKKVAVSFAVEPRPVLDLKADATCKVLRSWRLRDQGEVQRMNAPGAKARLERARFVSHTKSLLCCEEGCEIKSRLSLDVR